MSVATIPDPYQQTTGLTRVPQTVTAPQSFPLRAVIQQHADVLAPLCGAGVDLESVVSELWVASRKEPKLLQCTPQSVIPAIARALTVGGVIGRDVHLLVFGREAVDCLDYKFMAELAIKAGGARSIDARCVYAGDTFAVEYGTNPHIKHEPAPFGKPRGAMVGAYAVAFISAMTPPKFVVLRLEQIEAIRKKSQSWAKLPQCPEWYAAKTAVRQLFKLLPKNPKLASVLSRLEAADDVHEPADAVEIASEPWTLPGTAPLPPDVSPDGEDLTYEPEPDDDDAVVTVALDVALAMKVNGQVLGESRNSGLRAIAKWARSKMDDADKAGDEAGVERLQTIAAACDVILAARERGEIQEPAKAPKEAA